MNSSLLKRTAVLFLCFISFSLKVSAWGFYAHRMINEKAIYLLPTEMFDFYKLNMDYIREHAVDPDKRRYAVKEEGPRHYIDLDHYFHLKDANTLESIKREIPLYWDSAKSKFSEDTLEAYGLLPWHLNRMVYRLSQAFLENDASSILKLSAEIGHYAADAHVPLHTTENYNGQLTGQKGIHALWESRIPERKAEKYLFLMEKAEYEENIQLGIWEVIAQSHDRVNFVLSSEKELRSGFDPDKMYRPSTIGRNVVPQYTSAYVESYTSSNGDLVEQRMKESARFTAILWYTAWVNAGQPNLTAQKQEDLVEDLEISGSESDHEER